MAYILHVETTTEFDPFSPNQGHLICMPIEYSGIPDEVALQIRQIQCGYATFDATLGGPLLDIGRHHYFVLPFMAATNFARFFSSLRNQPELQWPW
jgi:hypothetical protein